MDFQAEKSLVLDYYSALDAARPEDVADILTSSMAPGYFWRGYHPFGLISDVEAVASGFWRPLKTAFTSLQRRQTIFFAGLNEIDGFQSVWTCSMGHLMGLFDAPWQGIQPTGKLAFLRYAEFNRVESGKIAETAMFFDIPHLARQAGQPIFAGQSAAHLVQPGPATQDGLLFGPQDAETGEATLALINAMISDLGTWALGLPLEEELARTWHDDMLWWGPEGIGATYTIGRYARQHSAPFRAAFSDRSKTSHICRIAEGNYGGFFGWPNFTARQTGAYLGLEGTGQPREFRVIDIYRRDGNRLAENWVYIDLLHFLQSGGGATIEGLATQT